MKGIRMGKAQVNKKFWKTFGIVFLYALVIVLAVLIFLWTNKLAFYSFSNEPYRKDSSVKTEISVTEDEKISELSKQLEQKEIIENCYLITIRYYCSDYRRYELRAGNYHVSADMGIDDLLNEFTGR
jgi:cell division protein YceG involved in septum cleavage